MTRIKRPPMNQGWHPDHKMPVPEFNGTSPDGSPDLGDHLGTDKYNPDYNPEL